MLYFTARVKEASGTPIEILERSLAYPAQHTQKPTHGLAVYFMRNPAAGK